jgi:hypothetical protein
MTFSGQPDGAAVFLTSFLADLWHALGLALGLSPDLPDRLLSFAHPGWVALAVAFLAGVSLMVADCVLLFANRVRPRRFVAGLLLNGLLHPLSQAVLAAALWLVATVIFQTRQSLVLTIWCVWLSSAPLLFGFLGMAGVLGDYPRWVVQGWSWLIILVVLGAGLNLAWWEAVLTVALGWLLVKLAKTLLDEPLGVASDWLWHAVTGGSLGMSLRTQRELRSGQLERETVMQLSRAIGDQLAGLRETKQE